MLLIIACPDYKTNTDMAKKLIITPVLDKMLDCRRNGIKHVNRMRCNILLKIVKSTDQEAEGTRGDH
jgi:hypothetical protein